MLPKVIIHNAVSVDGRIDGFEADMGQYYGLANQWRAEVMLSGTGTMLSAEWPEEVPAWCFEAAKALGMDEYPLKLVVVDSQGKFKLWHLAKLQPWWKTHAVLCSDSTPKEHLEYLEGEGIDYVIKGEDKVDLRAALEELNARYGVKTVRVDSGGALNGVLIREGLVDEISILVEPYIVGGEALTSFYQSAEIDAKKLNLIHCEKVENGLVWLLYEVVK